MKPSPYGPFPYSPITDRPRLRWPEIPLAIEGFLLRLLALDPNERPADGAAALEAFGQLKPN